MTEPIRRPQRRLSAEERERVRAVQSLALHRMLHLGLVDPVPNPSPMSEEEGAWVRRHVWPAFLRRIDDGYAFGFWRWSFCERGTCWNCLFGRCEWCMHRQKGGPDACDNTEIVHNHMGRNVAKFLPRPGGEPCVWWCRCPCSKNDEQGEPPVSVPTRPAGAPRRDGARRPGPERLSGGQAALPGL
ncbi:DUF6248 family natural product biosynthesis protein [Streptomyces sp. NPDC088768]|uniref:DUF6248 family natural product biosynthesis protein n=1 Tax=Streptomyces sp. NPDC088768 TaxID=3365894 RepID=UPI0038071C5E